MDLLKHMVHGGLSFLVGSYMQRSKTLLKFAKLFSFSVSRLMKTFAADFEYIVLPPSQPK